MVMTNYLKISGIVISILSLFICEQAQSQSYVQDCPQYPVSDYWDANCFIKTAEPYGEIRLPQGGVMGLDYENPMWVTIPTNRPEWAIGIAHAWNLHRNMINQVNFPKISYYMAITAHETGMACDCNAQFSAGHIPWSRSGNPPAATNNFPAKCGPAALSVDGCFQMEFLNAWGELNQIMPNRFPCDGFTRVVSGRSSSYKSLGTQALAMTYRNIAYSLLMEYSWQMDPWSVFGSANCDQYAYEKFLAASWNGSISGTFSTLTQPFPVRVGSTRPGVNLVNDRPGARNNPNWDLDATAGYYPEVIAWGMSAIEGNTTYPGYIYQPSLYWGGTPGVDINLVNNALPAQQNHIQLGNYNGAITWATVSQYIDTLTNFYFEYASNPTALNAIKANVQNVFVSISGNVATPIPFMQLGPVIDEIIISFPKENPLVQVLQLDGLPHGSTGNGPSTCGNGIDNSLGQYAPASHIVSRNIQSDTICIGQKLILAGEVVGGEEPSMSYTWYNNGTLTSSGLNDSLYIFTAATIGNYEFKLNVCNQEGGCADAGCTYKIIVTNCNVCGLIATGTTTNTPCRNTAAGSINLSISGAANYSVQYSGRTNGMLTGSASTVSIPNLLDGIYNIKVTNLANPTCYYTFSLTVGYDLDRSDVVRIVSSPDGSCGVNLQAEISSLNCQCNYTVNAVAFPGANQWERFITMKITPSNGRFEVFRGNTFGNPGVLSMPFQLCTGDSIKGELQIIPASGSCDPNRIPPPTNVQASTYDVWVTNSAGVEVFRQRYAPGSVTQGTDRLMFNIPVICPSTTSGYTFLWNPSGATTPGISVFDPNLSTTYTVTATLQGNAACVLQDSKFIPSICAPLPIQFISIEATKKSYGVLINWQMTEDNDRSPYFIERSYDPTTGFKLIGSVPVALGSYSYNDLTNQSGAIVYYRVYKRNQEGEFIYSKIVSVFPSESFYSVGPNPFTTETIFHSTGSGEFNLQILNLLGDKLESHITRNQYTEIGTSLSNGVYFLQILGNDGIVKTIKLIKEE
jgi:hypothetical protein